MRVSRRRRRLIRYWNWSSARVKPPEPRIRSNVTYLNTSLLVIRIVWIGVVKATLLAFNTKTVIARFARRSLLITLRSPQQSSHYHSQRNDSNCPHRTKHGPKNYSFTVGFSVAVVVVVVVRNYSASVHPFLSILIGNCFGSN